MATNQKARSEVRWCGSNQHVAILISSPAQQAFPIELLHESWSGTEKNGWGRGRGVRTQYVPSPFIPLSCTCRNFLDKLRRKRLLRRLLLSVSKELQAPVVQMLDSAFHHTVIYYYTVEPLYNGHFGERRKLPLQRGGRCREVETRANVWTVRRQACQQNILRYFLMFLESA